MEPTNETITQLDTDILALDKETIKSNRLLIKLTRWIIILTMVMILIGAIQLFISWPKRTFCITISKTVQLCEPDYWPYDTNPNDPAYQLDNKLNF